MAQQKPQFDMSTYAGKLKMLADVKEKKYQLPPDFPNMNEIEGKGRKFMSAHFAKTQARQQTIEHSREGRIQEMFVDDMPELQSSFRKTTRDYHELKEHKKLLHGALVGRY